MSSTHLAANVVNDSIDKQVADLLARMSLQEKVSQMSVRMSSGESPTMAAAINNQSQQEAVAASRHRIPLLFTRESSHGLNTVGVTSFPACITLASTWDEDLNYRIGRAIAVEARAQGVHQGLSPVLDVARDPRWGRMEETYGEDPHLVASLGVAFINGLQGDHLKDGIIATPKHLVGYGASEGGKDNDPISITERDLHETYLPPFEAAVREADAQSIMICYGALNGIPCTSDKNICADLPAQWGFTGHIVDDCPGIAGLLGHRAAHDIEEAIALGINAGIDRQFYDFIGDVPNQIAGQDRFEQILLKLVREGKVAESRINEAAGRVLRQKFMLGLFDNPLVDLDAAGAAADDPAHPALAREAAVKGIVLLKNEGNLLPLDISQLTHIAVIGPNAAEGQLGDYSGKPNTIISPLDGIRAAVGENVQVLHAKGCEILSPALVGARFSVRLSGSLKIDADDNYTFFLESNDGARLHLDGKTLIDDFKPGVLRSREATIHLARGDHAIGVEYFRGTRFLSTDPSVNDSNRNRLRLSWSSSSLPKRTIPTDNLTYRGELGAQQHASGEGLVMEPFLGPAFDRAMAEQNRVVREIDFDWGDRSPILASKADSTEEETIAYAVETALRAQVAIVCIGESSIRGPQQVCGEHFDRANIELTGAQQKLIDAVAATGKPIVAVLINGRALAIPKIAASSTALLEAWYPGQEGGHAIADILFGKVNPSGRLPVSFPHCAGHLPVYYNRRPRMGWYIDAESDPLFPFGFGLSYTKFSYSRLSVSPERGGENDEFIVSADITNIGPRAGDEVAQLYITDAVCTFGTPTRRLVGFQRLTLAPGETRTARFTIGRRELAQLDRDMNPRIEAGEFKVQLGSSSTTFAEQSLWVQ